jgi:hypothetical protein
LGPRQVDELSLWEFAEAIDGWKAANGVEEKPEPPNADEFYDMVARLG